MARWITDTYTANTTYSHRIIKNRGRILGDRGTPLKFKMQLSIKTHVACVKKTIIMQRGFSFLKLNYAYIYFQIAYYWLKDLSTTCVFWPIILSNKKKSNGTILNKKKTLILLVSVLHVVFRFKNVTFHVFANSSKCIYIYIYIINTLNIELILNSFALDKLLSSITHALLVGKRKESPAHARIFLNLCVSTKKCEYYILVRLN